MIFIKTKVLTVKWVNVSNFSSKFLFYSITYIKCNMLYNKCYCTHIWVSKKTISQVGNRFAVAIHIECSGIAKEI